MYSCITRSADELIRARKGNAKAPLATVRRHGLLPDVEPCTWCTVIACSRVKLLLTNVYQITTYMPYT